ncbi:MAG TPA: DUF2794 domain-containing protein [Patescibacteria group bacterium]|nr:DUF2794 domain-containing protein [Patescibacteria group bacterium]
MPELTNKCHVYGMLLYFRDKFTQGKARFSQGELSLILGLYGDRVKKGEWRDYAIDSLPDMALFSIYRSSKESPAYAIAKIPSKSALKPSQYAVYSGNQTLRQSASLSEVLQFFDEEK